MALSGFYERVRDYHEELLGDAAKPIDTRVRSQKKRKKRIPS